MSLLFGFSGIEIERKIKRLLVSFHNFGRPNLEFNWGINKYSNTEFESPQTIFRNRNRKKNKDIISFFS
jgi:hypothetical protein